MDRVTKDLLQYLKKEIFNSSKLFSFPSFKNLVFQCLGKGKGRQYPPLEEDTRNYLMDYFDPYNSKLVDLLTQHGFPIPGWLLSEEE